MAKTDQKIVLRKALPGGRVTFALVGQDRYDAQSDTYQADGYYPATDEQTAAHLASIGYTLEDLQAAPSSGAAAPKTKRKKQKPAD